MKGDEENNNINEMIIEKIEEHTEQSSPGKAPPEFAFFKQSSLNKDLKNMQTESNEKQNDDN